MKINGSNSVQGLFNSATVPVGAIYEVNDIVLLDSTLYVCRAELLKNSVDVIPDANLDSWEYYLGGVDKIKTFDEFEYGNGSELISLQALKEVIQNYWGGINSSGSLMLLNDPEEYPLESMMTNSSFQLSYNYMNKVFEAGEIKFSPSSSRVYVVRNTGSLNNGELTSPTLFTQELIEFSPEGSYKSWIRTGTTLVNDWKPTKGESFNAGYLTYLENLSNSYIVAKNLYDTFMTDINAGEYKFWKPVDIVKSGAGYLLFGSEKYNPNRYYKIYLHSGAGSVKVSTVVELAPQDFQIDVNSDLFLSGTENIYLRKPTEGPVEFRADPTVYTIVNVVQSTTLIN